MIKKERKRKDISKKKLKERKSNIFRKNIPGTRKSKGKGTRTGQE